MLIVSKKYLIIGASIIVLIAILIWAFVASTQPLPGVEELQNDRTHVPDGTKIDYKFNPPTSGPHYPDWITKGFYDEPRPDGNVVHSQEHGYVIFWYDCGAKLAFSSPAGGEARPDGRQTSVVRQLAGFAGSIVPEVYAQTATQTNPNGAIPMTGGSEGSPSASLKDMPKAFSDGSCNSLKNQIKDAIQENGDHKLIAMPRPNMGNPLTLTAWGRAEKLNSVDKEKIKQFIDVFRDHGPEQTVEP